MMTGLDTAPRGTAAPTRPSDALRVATASTPTVRQSLRRVRFWLVTALIAILGAMAIILINGGIRGPGEPLGADNPAPSGAMALVEVLRDHGVTVTEAETFGAAAIAATDNEATVFLHDPFLALDSQRLEQLAQAAATLVVVSPDFVTLDTLAPGVALAGVAAGGPLDAMCDLPTAQRAERLPAGLDTLALGDPALEAGWSGCFPSPDGGFALVTGPSPKGTAVTLVPATEIFANETITRDGSAALALGLLGQHEHLVWYVPGIADLGGEAPTLGELTPGWVTPLIVLLGVVTVCAGVWRGRRFGPLAVEDLPVTVKAGETMDGRARLYARTGSRLRALDNIRLGTVDRLARQLALGSAADVGEIADATAAAIAADRHHVRQVLVDAVPLTDADLVRLANQLQELELATARAIRPAHAADEDGNERES